MKWMSKNAKPEQAGWYYVREVLPKLKVGIRYFDDSNSSWWAPSLNGAHPNDTFIDWLNIPNISDRQRH